MRSISFQTAAFKPLQTREWKRVNWISTINICVASVSWHEDERHSLSAQILTLQISPFCLFTRPLRQQSLTAQKTAIEINFASCVLARRFLPPRYLLHPPARPTIFSPSRRGKSGSAGVKLMWWKTTGISLWAICFALTNAPLLSLLPSSSLGFLSWYQGWGGWGGGFCKLACGYLWLAAKCLADLTPQQTFGPLLELFSYSANF